MGSHCDNTRTLGDKVRGWCPQTCRCNRPDFSLSNLNFGCPAQCPYDEVYQDLRAKRECEDVHEAHEMWEAWLDAADVVDKWAETWSEFHREKSRWRQATWGNLDAAWLQNMADTLCATAKLASKVTNGVLIAFGVPWAAAVLRRLVLWIVLESAMVLNCQCLPVAWPHATRLSLDLWSRLIWGLCKSDFPWVNDRGANSVHCSASSLKWVQDANSVSRWSSF